MILISTAIVILHEIYGINDFMLDQIKYYEQRGFTVYCPNLLKRASFSYQEAEQAYEHYYAHYSEIKNFTFNYYIEKISQLHEAVYLLGFSVGGTLAWLCSDELECAGVIACYGSRIRDHLQIMPKCRTLLLFSQEPAFSIEKTVKSLEGKQNTTVRLFTAKHGFLDSYSANYHPETAKAAQQEIICFLNETFE